MKLPFRQGIVKYTSTNDKVPTFLYNNRLDTYVTLIANTNNVLITFAHNDVDYLFEEKTSIDNAWGPFATNIKYWLFWDIDVKTGKRTFGSTTNEPLVSETIPENPSVDQHWFNLKDNYIITYNNTTSKNDYRKLSKNAMYVWEDAQWTQRIRVFAGTYYKGDITINSLSSQVGLYEQCHAGYILYDDNDTPTQQVRLDGTYKFLTTESHFYNSKTATTTVSLDPIVHYGKAAVALSKFDFVGISGNNIFDKASSAATALLPAIGILEVNVPQNTNCVVVTNTNIENPAWNFTADPTTPVYLTPTGVSTIPPTAGLIQQVGYVINHNTIFVDISNPVIYHDVIQTNISEQIKVDLSNGKLYTTLVSSSDYTSSVSYDLYSTTYKQPIPNRLWTIVHNSHLPNFLVQVYDELGNYQIPSNITRKDNNTIEVLFTNRIQGTALVFLF